MPKRETIKNDEYSSDEEFEPEKYLRSLGFNIVRVRHYDQKALIEIPKDRFQDYKSNQDKIEKKIKTFGYDQVELDENGFRSGSLNKKAGIGK